MDWPGGYHHGRVFDYINVVKKTKSFGEVAEWLKAHAWKVCLGLNLTRVRIPPSPPYITR